MTRAIGIAATLSITLFRCYSVDYPAHYRCSNASPEAQRCPSGLVCNGTDCVPRGSIADAAGDAPKPDGPPPDQGPDSRMPDQGPRILTAQVFAGTGAPGFADGLSGTAQFNAPVGLMALPTGEVYVADTGNHCIRRIADKVVTTVAGKCGEAGNANGAATAVARFRYPSGILVTPSGLVVADTFNHCIRLVGQNGQVSTVAGLCQGGLGDYAEGPANVARFRAPVGLTLGASGEILVADTGNHCLRQINNGQVSLLAGACGLLTSGTADGALLAARFNSPSGIWRDPSRIVVSDTKNNCLRALAGNQVSTAAGTCDPGKAGFKDGSSTVALFNQPAGIAVKDGAIYLTELGNHTLRVVSPLSVVATLAGNGSAGNRLGPAAQSVFNAPSGVLPLGGEASLVADTNNHRILLIAPQ